MSFLSGWISNIIIFILLATVIDMLLPSSSLQKYTKMVIGLLLIAIIITPILSLFQTNFEQILASATVQINSDNENKLGNLTESKKKEIQAVQSAYILEQLANQLQEEVEEELMKKYQMKLVVTDIALNNEENPRLPDDLQNIAISLTEIKEDAAVETIAKVDIDTKSSLQMDHTDYEDVKQFLAQRWLIDEKLIQISGEGGTQTLKNEKGPLSWLQQLLNKNKDQKDKKPSIYVYVFIIAILGIGLMMVSSFFTSNQTGQTDKAETVFNSKEENKDTETFGQKKSEDFKTTREYEVYLQNEMKEALEMITGVEDVKVVIYVDATEKKEFERNKVTQKQVTEEADQEGGKRVVEDTSVDEQLVIIKRWRQRGTYCYSNHKTKSKWRISRS